MTTIKDTFFEKVWPLCIKEGAITHVHPEIIFAQCALETGYGLHAPQNNYFGIKGNGQALKTTEYVHGQAVILADHFSGYSSVANSFAGYGRFILYNERYNAFRSPGSISAQLLALGKSGYATDPNYVNKLLPIIDEIQSLEAKYKSPLATIKRVLKPVTPGLMPARAITNGSNMSDLSKLLDQHSTLLNTAANVIKALVSVAPIPAAAATAVDDIISGLQTASSNASTASTTAATATPAPVAATTVTLSQAESDALTAALSQGQSLIGDIVADFTNPVPAGSSITKEFVAQVESAAENVGEVVIKDGATLVEGLIQPIKVAPTAN